MHKIFLIILITFFISFNLFSQKNFNGKITYKVTIIKNDNDTSFNNVLITFTDTTVIIKHKNSNIETEFLDIKTGDFTTYNNNPPSFFTIKATDEDNIEKYISNKQRFQLDSLFICNRICKKASLNFNRKYPNNYGAFEIISIFYLSDLQFNVANDNISYNPFYRNSFNRIPLFVLDKVHMDASYGFNAKKTKIYEAISIEPL